MDDLANRWIGIKSWFSTKFDSHSRVKLFTKGEDKRKAGWFGVLDQRGGTLDPFLKMD